MMKSAFQFVWLLPRNALALLLALYRSVISPLYGDVCRYYPTCSHFTLQAVQQYGAFRGSWMGAARIARCHPWAAGGVDDVPQRKVERYSVNRFGFVSSNCHRKGAPSL